MERMGRKDDARENDKIVHILKALLAAYVLTGGLLILLALLLYRFMLSESIVSISIIAIYVVASFVAGTLVGGKAESRKFLWGLIMGILYFVVLALVSLLVNHSLKDVANNFFSVFMLCAGGGMMGGMYCNLRRNKEVH